MTHPPTPATTPLPCPFCGEMPEITKLPSDHFRAGVDSLVQCMTEDCAGNNGPRVFLYAWNRRSALPVPPVATALDEKGLPCAWCNGLPGHFDWCTNPALAASPNEPVVSATADHPAIYKDGHRLVAGNRATLPSTPVARSGEVVAWHLHPSVVETARQLHKHLATANRSAQWLNEAYELCQRLGDAVSALYSPTRPATGTYKCPICGLDRPHVHTDSEITEHRGNAHLATLPASPAPSGEPTDGKCHCGEDRGPFKRSCPDHGHLAHPTPSAVGLPSAGEREVNLAINAYDDAKAQTAYNLRYNFSPAQVEEDKRNEFAARAALLALLSRPVPARPLDGLWPRGVHRAFVEGVKWWEWVKESATMWAADVDKAEAEALKRYGPAPASREEAE